MDVFEMMEQDKKALEGALGNVQQQIVATQTNLGQLQAVHSEIRGRLAQICDMLKRLKPELKTVPKEAEAEA